MQRVKEILTQCVHADNETVNICEYDIIITKSRYEYSYIICNHFLNKDDFVYRGCGFVFHYVQV